MRLFGRIRWLGRRCRGTPWLQSKGRSRSNIASFRGVKLLYPIAILGSGHSCRPLWAGADGLLAGLAAEANISVFNEIAGISGLHANGEWRFSAGTILPTNTCKQHQSNAGRSVDI